jgi:hypothetical protein
MRKQKAQKVAKKTRTYLTSLQPFALFSIAQLESKSPYATSGHRRSTARVSKRPFIGQPLAYARGTAPTRML